MDKRVIPDPRGCGRRFSIEIDSQNLWEGCVEDGKYLDCPDPDRFPADCPLMTIEAALKQERADKLNEFLGRKGSDHDRED